MSQNFVASLIPVQYLGRFGVHRTLAGITPIGQVGDMHRAASKSLTQ